MWPLKNSQQYFDRIEYQWEQDDSVIYLNKYFSTDGEDFWMFPEVNLKSRFPKAR